MKIAIVGYDVEGRASYDYFAAQGHELTICDQNESVEIAAGVASVLGEGYLDSLDRFDLIVRTAGLPPQRILEKNPDVAHKITTQINEFMQVCPTQNIIGVTGTKGKGTTSTLITNLLEASGRQTWLGGNIGTPPFTFLNDLTAESWVVLELSSFQLSDLARSPHIGVCLMVVPEHLNWHDDMDDYSHAKSQLFAHQTSADTAIYYAENELSQHIAAAGEGQKIPFYAPPGAFVSNDTVMVGDQVICSTEELKLLGTHNWQNVCAAITAVWQITQDVEVIRNVVTTFTGLPHRLEFVRDADGVRFYNDSFAAGLHATEAAIEAIPGSKVLIVGGFDRNLDIAHFGEFAKSHKADLRSLLLIGQSAQRLAETLEAAGYASYIVDTEHTKTMHDIVHKAASLAQPGDSVVFSPGFASFDMFKNFEDRGLQFKATVENL